MTVSLIGCAAAALGADAVTTCCVVLFDTTLGAADTLRFAACAFGIGGARRAGTVGATDAAGTTDATEVTLSLPVGGNVGCDDDFALVIRSAAPDVAMSGGTMSGVAGAQKTASC